jgi:hypothetical protein
MNRKSHEMYSIARPLELVGRDIFLSFIKDPAVFEQMEPEPSSPLDAIMGKLQIGKVDKQQHVNTGTHPSTNAEELGINNGKASAEATKPGDHSKSSKPLIGKATSSSPSTRSSLPPSKIKRSSRTRRGGVRSKREDPPQLSQMPPSFWRRGSMGSCDSMSLSSAESMPKKKKMVISLRPHRSKDLYEAQRNDSELRELMQSKNAASLTIRTVHEKNLVFYGAQRVYIPKSLRETTMDFYRKKYKYKPIERMEEWCYWPRIDRDPRRLFQWKVCVTEAGKEPELLYDSDDYEFPNPRK